MNLLHLHYFYTVAKEGGFLRASKLLRIQQPAISRMVHQLEEDMGFKLFERVGRNVQLTAQGSEVFASSKKIFAEVDSLKLSVGQLSHEKQGPLLLAAAEPVASHYIPAILKAYMDANPKVYPQIFSGPAAMLFDKLLNGSLELGIFFHIPELPERLEIFTTKKTRYYLVVRKDLRRKTQILESFIGSREIDDVSTKKFPTLDRLRKDYPEAKITISSNNLTAHKALVLQGLGVAVLPDFLVEAEIKNGSLLDLYPKENFQFQLKFIKRKTSVLSANASYFLDLCLKA
ncbi:MAG: LysR family transcriptional regulator [Bdellovibrionota bacterium]